MDFPERDKLKQERRALEKRKGSSGEKRRSKKEANKRRRKRSGKEARQARRREMLSSVNERSIEPTVVTPASSLPSASSSRELSVLFVLRGVWERAVEGVKIELRCHHYPSESRSIWKRGETRRRPRNPRHRCRRRRRRLVLSRLRKLSPCVYPTVFPVAPVR